MPAAGEAKRRFRLILIKPSHYDDDGYVIQWWRSSIPSNSLASVSWAAGQRSPKALSARRKRPDPGAAATSRFTAGVAAAR